MSGDADFGLCAEGKLRIRAEYKISTKYSHLVMAFVSGPVDSTDARERGFF